MGSKVLLGSTLLIAMLGAASSCVVTAQVQGAQGMVMNCDYGELSEACCAVYQKMTDAGPSAPPPDMTPCMPDMQAGRLSGQPDCKLAPAQQDIMTLGKPWNIMTLTQTLSKAQQRMKPMAAAQVPDNIPASSSFGFVMLVGFAGGVIGSLITTYIAKDVLGGRSVQRETLLG